MLKKISLLVLGVLFIGFVVWLGVKTNNDNTLIVWFGIAAAVIAPLGFSIIGYAFTADNQKIIKRLSKVPDIQKLILQSKTEEEKIQILERQRNDLLKIIELEAKQQSLIEREKTLIEDAIRILSQLNRIYREKDEIGANINSVNLNDNIKELRDRVNAARSGDLIFKIFGMVFRINKEVLNALPILGVSSITKIIQSIIVEKKDYK